MNVLSDFIKYFYDNFTSWYIISVIFGVIFLYQIIIKNEWKKLRIENNICYDDDTSFQYRRIWLLKKVVKIHIIITFIVCLVNVFLINETDFISTITTTQKIRNIIPTIAVYISFAFCQKVSIKEESTKNFDKIVLLLLKMKNEMLIKLVNDEIYYIKQKNKKEIHKIREAYIEDQVNKKDTEDLYCKFLDKLLYILLIYSDSDEFQIKHKYKIKAFQSDSKKQDYLERVISIRSSLIGEKPFNIKEFDFFCVGILPEIGVCYSDIYATIKKISNYKNEFVECEVRNRDLYFQGKYVKNCVASEEMSNDSFNNEINKIFDNNLYEEEILCTAEDNH